MMHREKLKRFPIPAIILTYNEAQNIVACLDSLKWVDEVVLIDSFSTDETVELAQEARPDIRVLRHVFLDFGDQRNWALDHGDPEHAWVLFLDADERCTNSFREALEKSVQQAGDCVGYYLTCRNFFMGTWIKHCTLYPSWQLRLLKMGHVRFLKEGHGQREVTEGVLDYIQEPYDHYGFSKGIEDWIERHNGYSSNEVELILRDKNEPLRVKDIASSNPVSRRRALKRLAARVGCRPLMRFIYMYFLRCGFLDGRAGWHFCMLRVAHEIHITAKVREAKRLHTDS